MAWFGKTPLDEFRFMNLVRLRAQTWQLAQANRELSSELMTLANKAAPAAPVEWAAKVLALSHASGMTTDFQVLVSARVAAFSSESLMALPTDELRQRIVEMRQLAVDLQIAKANGAVSAKGPRPAAPASDVRSTQAARAKFNNPPHWQELASLIVPNVASMVGESARAWGAVTLKFGENLAQRMFDANVRGSALAVISVMDAVGSQQTLTVHDLTALQYAAITNGTKPRQAVAVEEPTLHDTFHCAVGYGVSALEETFGDEFSESMINSLFGAEADIHVALNTPLHEQTAAVKQIKSRIRENFSSTTTEGITRELGIYFAEAKRGGWSGSAVEMTQRAEKTLVDNGLLAHLDPAGQQKINALIYGGGRAESFEAIVTRYTSSKDLTAFQRELQGWENRVTLVLQAESKKQTMPLPEFERSAARAIAFGLVLERAVPGTLFEGPLSIGLNDAELAPAFRTLDLRVAFPRTLREVQSALAQWP
jgi:hypothetical protein